MTFDAYTKSVLTVIAICLIWLCFKDVNILSVQAASQVERKAVKGYAFGWNKDQNKGVVQYVLEDGQKHRIEVTSAAELAGWAAVLNQKRVVRDQNGWLLAAGAVPGQ